MKMKMTLGVDLGWLSQLEAQGVRWVDQDKKEVEVIQAMKEMGADSVRLRIFVNPPKEAYWTKKDGTVCMLGFCDAESVLAVSKRVHEAGMKLMLDFHYSDHFADPEYQDIPEEWANEDADGLTRRVYQHTKDVLELFTQSGIVPEWVQVGNEINPGILLPAGSCKEHPEQMAAFLNAGYDAVKECCPDCQVVTHISCGNYREYCDPFLETFFKYGGKTDVLGFSYYPYWYDRIVERTEKKPMALLYNPLTYYAETYQKSVMICEVGGPETDEEGTYNLLMNAMEAVRQVADGMGAGVFYWEPEVGAALVPDNYPLGAGIALDEHTVQLTGIMTAYRDFREKHQ
ncbi:MAG: glycosyl hydrolase 53 family protein [Roseburia sp.]|nr:glycosyl hydrolase 53 family protein [Roseburia sp.]MCM1243174.1 glycosyl hydrolase 53 family protein [Roseburia sp.]